MTFSWNIHGHDSPLSQLERDISSNSLSHCYLFSGPAHCGKTAAAQRFAAFLQCGDYTCDDCACCLQLSKGSHIDTIELHDDGSVIKIKTIRDVIDRVMMTRQSNYKVILIYGVERLSVPAANCLLKTLEEAPENTVFVLTSSSTDAVLDTVVSRSRVIRFSAVSSQALDGHLRTAFPEASSEDLALASRLSFGKIGVAFSLMRDEELRNSYRDADNELAAILKSDHVYEKFQYCEKLAENIDNLPFFMDIIISLVRDRSLNTSSPQSLTLLDRIHELKTLRKNNLNTKLVLENIMLSL